MMELGLGFGICLDAVGVDRDTDGYFLWGYVTMCDFMGD